MSSSSTPLAFRERVHSIRGSDRHRRSPLRLAFAVILVALVGQMQALTAAGAFGRGANQQVVRAVRAITDVLTSNLLGFVGATLVLVIVGLAAGHIYGDERATEKTLRVVKGVFMLVAAAGIVA